MEKSRGRLPQAPAAAREVFQDLKYGVRIHWGFMRSSASSVLDFLKMTPVEKQLTSTVTRFNRRLFDAAE